ncbi:MAG: PASTA domain-containing protein [Chloroflexota bacterium]
MHKRFTVIWLMLSLWLLMTGFAIAQENTVPDLTGLNVPQAAARLNEAGLRLGIISANAEELTTAQPGTVLSQATPAGTSANQGDTVDITVLSDARVRFVYDDNDLTMINATGATVDLSGLTFDSDDGTRRFLATTWRGDLAAGDCTQIWSISRRDSKQVEGCDLIHWLTTTNDETSHFWTQSAGVSQFSVVQNGEALATCDAAPPNSQNSPTTCDFLVITDAITSPATDYVYFAYTTDRFAVINISNDLWMPLTETPIYNFNPQLTNIGASLSLGDPNLFRSPEIVGEIERLAPNQCLMLTVAPLTDAEAPESCNVLAQRELEAGVAFWLAPFELDSPFSEENRAICPAATEGRLTRCIMPG